MISFRLGELTGDNLGLHSMLGIVECFSDNYLCRICTALKEIIRIMSYENSTLLRACFNK